MQKKQFEFILLKDRYQKNLKCFGRLIFLILLGGLLNIIDGTSPSINQLQAEESATNDSDAFLQTSLSDEYALIFQKIENLENAYAKEIAFFKLESHLNESKPTFYIATNGNDSWSGKLAEPNADCSDGPFATFARAQRGIRDICQQMIQAQSTAESMTIDSEFINQKALIVLVRGGIYEFTAPFELTEEDSGKATLPIIWKAAEGEEVRLVGGKYLSHFATLKEMEKSQNSLKNESVDKTIFPSKADSLNKLNILKKTDISKAKKELNPEIQEKILYCDLKAEGINDYGSPAENGAEIFYEQKPLHLSRYPNQGFLKIKSLTTEGTTPIDVRGTKGIVEGSFQFDDNRLLNWEAEDDIWVHGYWFWDWSEQRHKVESIDSSSKTLNVLPPFHSYGYRVGQWFYAFNLLSEIDEPGEFYIDRNNGILYFYPPQQNKSNDSSEKPEVVISIIPNIIKMKNVSNIVWDGFIFEAARQDAIVIDGGNNNLISRCSIRNIGGTGISANGFNHEIFDCHLYQCGRGGINMNGGDRTTLMPGNNRIIGNRIHDFGRIQRVYAAGIQIGGVGNYVGYNQIYDAPHMGIGFGGNDHLIEFNEISNVCFESNDAGAVYTGRNWTMRGTILCFNYLHDITGFENQGCVGIYFDDMFSSADIVGNLFKNVTRATFLGGGRDCGIFNNIFVDCQPALHIDARALGWAHYHADSWLEEAQEKKTISGIKWNKPPYSDRYPKLATMLESGKTPKAPEGNYIANNICVGGTWDINKKGQWQGDSVQNDARPYLTFENNLVLTEDSVLMPFPKQGQDDDRSVLTDNQASKERNKLFIDPENNNFQIRTDYPHCPNGFHFLPLEKIGCCPTSETIEK
ncbi:MAG: right-handed parallel beta-helix repeat-containing protein [Planctomycetia bacterium]|nr:right-handed parallel beta-helix repeat-containing protein [Planctomycetia bacterium]